MFPGRHLARLGENERRIVLTLILLANTDPAIPTQPGLRPGLTEDQITPGLLGFVMTFGIVLVMFFLIRDMVKRVRRVRYRAQVEESHDGVPAQYQGIPIMSEADMQKASYGNLFNDAASETPEAQRTDAETDNAEIASAETDGAETDTQSADQPDGASADASSVEK